MIKGKHIFILFVISISFLFAQYRKAQPEFGIGLNATRYSGDLLNGSESWLRQSLGGSFWFTFEGKSFIAPLVKIEIGSFSADNRELQNVPYNTFVKTTFVNPAFMLSLKPWNRKRIHPVLGAGVGLLFFKPSDADNNSLAEKNETRAPNETYSTNTVNFPLLIGFHYKLTPNIHFGLSYNFLGGTTDYLDNIGELGERPGNDRLQNITLSFHLIPFQMSKAGRYRGVKHKSAKRKCSCPKH